MNSSAVLNTVLSAANNRELVEVGGGHNQKGVDFQRHWAIMRMVQLEEAGATDYLFLFEAIQDIAELDSSTEPTAVRVYQVKKKERREWTWAELTGIPVPQGSRKSGQRKPDPPRPEAVGRSPIGKLYASVLSFDGVACEAYFVSNAGCDIPLADGSNAATSLPCNLSLLAEPHLGLLSRGLESLHSTGMPTPDLGRLHICRVALSIDDLSSHLIGIFHRHLQVRSPRHAGQAQALYEALLARVGPLGARTDSVRNFEDLRNERGYSRDEFIDALSTLEQVPDVVAISDQWIEQLGREGMGIMDCTRMRLEVARCSQRQLAGRLSRSELSLALDCEAWLAENKIGNELLPWFEKAHKALRGKHPRMRRNEILAQLALRAIYQCVDPTYDG